MLELQRASLKSLCLCASVVNRASCRRCLRRARRTAIAALALTLTGILTWQIALRTIPYPAGLDRYPRGATLVEDKDGHIIAAFVGQEDAWYLPLASEDISPHLKDAIVAVEDRRFYQHAGVDWRSVAGAAWQDLTSFHIVRGASTIDMQVQHLRDPRPRSWPNKLQQAFRADQLDRTLSKDSILTEYINRAPFGGNLVGAGAASWRYFGKPCRDLSLGQAALLAGLPQSPNRYRPDRTPDKAAQRRRHVLDQMLAAGMITPDQLRQADAEPIEAAWRTLPQDMNHRAWGALPALANAALRHPGQIVRTTIDPVAQAAAWRIASEPLPGGGDQVGIDSVAIVVVDVPTAEIRATVSLSSAAPAVDLTAAPRSTGSVLKPFLYAAAFDMGILTPQSPLVDSPHTWAGYAPDNYDKIFRGRMTAADALAESRNLPAMLVLSKVGIEHAIGTMEQLGIKTPAAARRAYGLSLAIGGAEASPLEVAEAYSALARGGIPMPLRLTPATLPHPSRVFPAPICWQTLNCLNDRLRTESVDGALPAANLAAAWKTGTSNGLRDAWCAAATPRLVVVVWLGNAAGRGNSALVGQQTAAPLALTLLATLDPGGPAFPTTPPAANPPTLAANNRLSILKPVPGTNYLTDSPGDSPRIALKSAGGSGTRRAWFANGQFIANSDDGQTAWWPATPGTYEIRVIDESGHASAMRIRVR